MQVSLDEVLRGMERVQNLVLDGSQLLHSEAAQVVTACRPSQDAVPPGRESSPGRLPALGLIQPLIIQAGQNTSGLIHSNADPRTSQPVTADTRTIQLNAADTRILQLSTNGHQPTAAAQLLFDLAVQEQTHKDARRTGLHSGWITLGEARALARDAGIRCASDAVLVACVRGDIAGATRKGQAWIMPFETYQEWEDALTELTTTPHTRCRLPPARSSARWGKVMGLTLWVSFMVWLLGSCLNTCG